MGVLDRLPESRLVGQLRKVVDTTKQIKSFQNFGSRAIKTFRIFSPNATDITAPFTSSYQGVLVEFIPDDKTFGGAMTYDLVVRCFHVEANAYFKYFGSVDRVRTAEGKQQWLITFHGQGTFRLKFYFMTNCPGTFTATLVT